MITTPTIGQTPWGTDLNNQLETLAHDGVNPNDHGLIAWNYLPAQAAQALQAVTQQVRITRMPALPEGRTVTSVCMFVTTASTGGTAGQNFMGLYSAAGALLGSTADATTAFSTTGPKVLALAAPAVVPAGVYYVALLATATTPLQFAGCTSLASLMTNFNQTASQSSYANVPGSFTSLPVSITMSGLTQTSFGMWAGMA